MNTRLGACSAACHLHMQHGSSWLARAARMLHLHLASTAWTRGGLWFVSSSDSQGRGFKLNSMSALLPAPLLPRRTLAEEQPPSKKRRTVGGTLV